MVSMVCCSNGVQPRSSSPWLMILLNSWKRSFSCCCWMGDRCSGTGGWRRGLEAAGRGGESAMATISRVPAFWPECRRKVSGWWLWIAIHTSEPLESVGTPDTNVGRASFWAEVDILSGPGVMTADQSSSFGGDVGGLEQQCTALGGGSCFWVALRWMVCESGYASVAVPLVTSMQTSSGRIISIPIKTGGDSRPMIIMKQARPRASPHWRLRCWVFPAIWSGFPWAPWTTPSKGSRDPIGRGIATTPRIPCRSLKRRCRRGRGLGCPRG